MAVGSRRTAVVRCPPGGASMPGTRMEASLSERTVKGDRTAAPAASGEPCCSHSEVVAALRRRALAETDIDALMTMIVGEVAEVLGTDRCQILELTANGEALLIRAAIGWKPGIAGHGMVPNTPRIQAGYTLVTNAPVIMDDLAKETRFDRPKIVSDREVVSGVSVVIGGKRNPFGVLSTHTSTHKAFTEDDVCFLTAVAGIVADAVDARDAAAQ